MAVARPRKKKWIPKDMDKGAYTRWCKSQGFSGVTAACIAKGLRTGGKRARQASLARTLQRIVAKRKKKGRV